MKNKYLYQFSYILLCILFLRCIAAAQTSATETNSAENPDKNLVHFGDLIDVDVLGSIEYDWRGRLNPEGFLDGIDFIEEPVFGLCRSEEEIAADIAKGYEKLLREPKVVVRVIDRSDRALSVLDGAVKKPQRYQIKRSVYLNELIILAGGLTERASGEIRIFRPQNLSCAAQPKAVETASSETDENREKFVKTSQNAGSQTFDVKISELLNGTKEANPQILSGDIVTVLEADPIYIIGGVSSPKQISSRTQITVSRAIASAGGIAKEGLEDSVTIFRRNGTETKIIEVDLGKIKSGQAEDLVLQGFDIVDVGQKGRAKKKYPPIIQLDEINAKKLALLPLKIID
jgi:protein involved in polysaccharide export with SLBB domain